MRLHAAAGGEREVADEVDWLGGFGEIGEKATICRGLGDSWLRCHGGWTGVVGQVHGEVEVGALEVGACFDDVDWWLGGGVDGRGVDGWRWSLSVSLRDVDGELSVGWVAITA